MIPALLVGVLCALTALAVLLPMWSNGPRARGFTLAEPDEDRRRELLRQLRDIDEDLAAGKILPADHQRLRAPVEREAAMALAGIEDDSLNQVHATEPGVRRPPRPTRGSRLVRWTVAVALGGIAVGAVALTLLDAVDPRPGTAQAAAETADRVAAVAPEGTAAEDAVPGAPFVDAPTRREVATVKAAVARVSARPRNVVAHLELARAYADAGQRQLSTIEYLAVTRLDPGNPEASTALALVAFSGGDPNQAMRLVEDVLEAHPRHPEALYARGVIHLMGLNQPGAARRDLEAYLDAAPFGSHREAVDTLLRIIDGRTAR
jgi:tetratricopeptide (TPR) repeat protein